MTQTRKSREVPTPERSSGRSTRRAELVPLTEGAWRLCDRSVGDDDPANVIAYVEETVVGIEVVWLQIRTGRETFARLDDVLAAAALGSPPARRRRARSRRPVDIPALAPKLPPQ